MNSRKIIVSNLTVELKSDMKMVQCNKGVVQLPRLVNYIWLYSMHKGVTSPTITTAQFLL